MEQKFIKENYSFVHFAQKFLKKSLEPLCYIHSLTMLLKGVPHLSNLSIF